MGFTISSHYCGGKKVKTTISLGESDLTCGMKMANDCNNHKQFKKKCCENDYQNIQVEEDYTPQSVDYTSNVNFAATFLLVNSNFVSLSLEKKFNYNNHSPPLIVKDIPVLIQSFLI